MAAKLPRIPQAWADDFAGGAGDAVSDGTESVVSEDLRPSSDGAEWEARAYFTDPYRMGWTGDPKDLVHGGIKIYRNGKFVYSINARGQRDHLLKDGTLGNLVLNRDPPVNERSSLADETDSGEVTLTPPRGVSPENFAQALMTAARSYDESLPYSLPTATVDVATDISDPLVGGPPGKVPYGFQNSLAPRTYNSNSFLAGLLANVGAGSNIEAINRYLRSKKHAAPGIENPISRDRFRIW